MQNLQCQAGALTQEASVATADTGDRLPHIARLWHQNELCDSGTRLYWVWQTTGAEEIHAEDPLKLIQALVDLILILVKLT